MLVSQKRKMQLNHTHKKKSFSKNHRNCSPTGLSVCYEQRPNTCSHNPSSINHQLGARRALSIFKVVWLITRKALSMYSVYGDSTLLVLKETYFDIDSALLTVNLPMFYFMCHVSIPSGFTRPIPVKFHGWYHGWWYFLLDLINI